MPLLKGLRASPISCKKDNHKLTLGTPMSVYGTFPLTRLRRNREHAWLRNLLREHSVSPCDLIWPVFIRENDESPLIPSMPGISRFTLAELDQVLKEAYLLNIQAIALFPTVSPHLKTDLAEEAYNPSNLMCRAIRHIKDKHPHMGVIADVALDPYTSHGHDGLLVEGYVANDATVEVLIKQAVVQAKAGADIIAPSDMMDGRIQAIRHALDAERYSNVRLLSYAAKYASAFYGPFREAVGSKGIFQGDKKTYQMDPANAEEALREAALDIQEGADILMIKPGLPYLDIIYRVKQAFQIPLFAYHVSGEYAMIKAACDHGWLDYPTAMLEALLALKRAGADAILTYNALEVAKILND